MREIFVESEHQEFPCPAGFVAATGESSMGLPVEGGRARAKPLFMHRLLAPDELTQAALFVYRNWKSRRCFPNPARPQSPLWWVVEGESEHFVLVEGERHRASLTQIPTERLFELVEEATLRLPVAVGSGLLASDSSSEAAAVEEEVALIPEAELTVFEDADTPPQLAPLELVSEHIDYDADSADHPVAADEADKEMVWTERGTSEATRLPEQAHIVIHFAEPSDESADLRESAPLVDPVPPRRDDPFRRSLDAVLAELTAPVTVDAERQTRVAVRVTAGTTALAADGPLTLPSRPELVSSDFLAHTEVSRPALMPIGTKPTRTTLRVPTRAFALAAGALVLFVTLAVWLFR
jgi:hypothetical protein